MKLAVCAEVMFTDLPLLERIELNLHGTALDDRGLPVVPQYEMTGEMWLSAAETLQRLADLGRRNEVTFVLENLNTEVDHPGVPFAKAKDVLALIPGGTTSARRSTCALPAGTTARKVAKGASRCFSQYSPD